jgi:metal-sulfur cluster biosynthetic enzyme
MSSPFDDAIKGALEHVCDPCSIAANAPINILDMGLVRDWSVDDQANLVVRMCVTSPSCTMGPHMVRAAEELLSRILGLNSVKVEVDSGVFWKPEHITGPGRAMLEERRSASMAKSPVTPQQWRRHTRTGGDSHGERNGVDSQRESST